MQYENFKSDFKLEVTLMLGGAAIAVPAHDFELVFSSGDGPERYVCGRCGGEWLRCSPTADNSKLVCYLDNHRLGPGVLKCLFVDHAPDGEMPDGEMRKVVPQELDVELVVDAGEDAVEVDADVVVSVETLLGDVRALADELETKKASNYWKGVPGAPGAPGTPGVGITSVVQTTTSHVSEGENIVTVTLSNGQQSTFSVFNGEAGSGGGDLASYCPIIEDTRSSNVAAITGVAPFASLETGQRILLHLAYGTAASATLNLTLSDGTTTTGAKTMKIAYNASFVDVGTGYTYIAGCYIPLVYNGTNWRVTGRENDTTYSTMSQSTLNTGTATTGNAVSAKLLRDNFYLKSEADNICPIIEDTRTSAVAEITGTAPFSELVAGQRIVLHFKYRNEASPTLQLTLSGGDTTLAYPLYQNYNSGVGALTVQAMPAGSYGEFVYDATNSRWMLIGKDVNTTYSYTSQTDINNSAQGSRLIEPALLRSNFYLKSEAQAKRTLVDNTSTSGTVTLSVNGYHDLGERSAVAVALPTTTATVAGYEVEISGVSSDIDAFMEAFAIYDDDPYDYVSVQTLLEAQDVSGGTTQTYDLTSAAHTALASAIIDRDTAEDTVPEVTNSTAKQVQHTVAAYTRVDEFLFTFVVGDSWGSVTLPQGVKLADGFDWSEAAAGVVFQVSIQDGVCAYLVVSPTNP